MAGDKPTFGKPSKPKPRASGLEKVRAQKLTHEDIVAHINETQPRTDLENEQKYPGIQSMIRNYRELLQKDGGNAGNAPVAKTNALRFGGLVAQINFLLGKTQD